MVTGMKGYEAAVAEKKAELFDAMLGALTTSREAVVVELGMGSFPNARYYVRHRTRPPTRAPLRHFLSLARHML